MWPPTGAPYLWKMGVIWEKEKCAIMEKVWLKKSIYNNDKENVYVTHVT